MSNLLKNLETTVKNYLKFNKKLSEKTIQQLMLDRSKKPLSFWKSPWEAITADSGIERGISVLLAIHNWNAQNKTDGLELQKLVFNFLQHKMGSSNNLHNQLADVLASNLGLNVQAIFDSHSLIAGIETAFTNGTSKHYEVVENSIRTALQQKASAATEQKQPSTELQAVPR